jgi:hypothetical protein
MPHPVITAFTVWWEGVRDICYKSHALNRYINIYRCGLGEWSRYRHSLWVGWSGDRVPVRKRFPATVQTGPQAQSASCTMGTGSFPGVCRHPTNLIIMFRDSYCYVCSVLGIVSLCCSVYFLHVNVYCTTATGCQPNCSYQIYHIISIAEVKKKVQLKLFYSSGPSWVVLGSTIDIYQLLA